MAKRTMEDSELKDSNGELKYDDEELLLRKKLS